MINETTPAFCRRPNRTASISPLSADRKASRFEIIGWAEPQLMWTDGHSFREYIRNNDPEMSMNQTPHRSALDVVNHLKAATELTSRQRSDKIHAVRSIVRQLMGVDHIDDESMARFQITDLTELDRLLRALPGRCIGLSARSMAHGVSTFRSALRVAGIPIVDGRGHRPLSAAWSSLLDQVAPAERTILLPLATWMSDHDVEPTP